MEKHKKIYTMRGDNHRKAAKPELTTDFTKESVFADNYCDNTSYNLGKEENRKLNVLAKHFNTAKVEILRTLLNECYKQLFDTKAGDEENDQELAEC